MCFETESKRLRRIPHSTVNVKIISCFYIKLEVLRPSGPQLVVGGPSGRLDFVIYVLGVLRPGDPRNDVVIG